MAKSKTEKIQTVIDEVTTVSDVEVFGSRQNAQEQVMDQVETTEPQILSDEQIINVADSVEVEMQTPNEDAYEVAGLGNVLKSVTEESTVKFRDVVGDVNIQKLDGENETFFAKATEDEQQFLQDVLKYDFVGPENIGQISLKLPNFDNIKDLESLKRFKEAFNEGYGSVKGKVKISNEDLFAAAREIDNTAMMDEILSLPKGKQFDAPEKVLLANALNAQMLIRTKQLAQAIVDDVPVVNTGNKQQDMITTKLLYSEQLQIFKLVNENVTENNANIGRSLGILAKIRNYFASSTTFGNEAGVAALKDFPGIDTDNYVKHAQDFLSLDRKAQSGYIKGSPSLLDKGRYVADVLTEMRLMSLLSSFRTDARNILGTGSFTMYTNTVDVGASAIISKIRKQFTPSYNHGSNRDSWVNRGVDDFVDFSEIAYRSEGMMRATNEAYASLSNVLKTGDVADMNTKFDSRSLKALSAEELSKKFPDFADSGFGKSIDLWGKVIRFKGRLLLGSDEFFKIINFRAELYAQAYRKRDQYLKRGYSVDEAEKAAAKVLNNPTQAEIDVAVEAARVNTFTNDLDGILGKLQGPMSHPIAKLFVPFYRTPTNLILRMSERSPLALAMPSVWREMKAGGSRFDRAVGKMSAGSAILVGIAQKATGLYDSDFVCTGAEPQSDNEERIWRQQQIPKYSCGFKNPDTGQYDFVSYESFEPMSGIIAMGSTIGHAAKNTPTDATTIQKIEDLLMAGSYAMYDHVTHLPFLEEVAEFDKIFDKGTHESRMKALTSFFGQTITEAGIQTAQGSLGFPFGSSFLSDLERASDPRRSITAPDESASGWVYGYRKALNIAKSRIPGMSGDLPVSINFWGEEVLPGSRDNSIAWEVFSPFAIRDTNFNDINIFFQQYVGADLAYPSQTVQGIPLSGKQYADYLTLINSVTLEDGRTMKERLLAEIYNSDGNQYHAALQVYDKEFGGYRQRTPREIYNYMNSIFTDYKKKASEELIGIDYYPDLQKRINERNKYLSENPLGGTTRGQF